MSCYGCGVELTTENRSEEHIINNSLGGITTSDQLICRDCNSRFGDTIDAELAGQLGTFVKLLDVTRARDSKTKIVLEAEDGEKKTVGKALKPHHVLILEFPDGKTVEIAAETEEEFEKLKEKKIKELEKKYPKTKYEEFIKQPTKKKFHIPNKNTRKAGEVGFGGLDYFRAIGKIALNYALYSGVPQDQCSHLIDFVNGTNEDTGIINYYYPDHYRVHDLSDSEVSHILHVIGDDKNRILFVYVELLNFQNFIVVVNDDYHGPNYEQSYCLNVVSGEELEKTIKIKLLRHHIEVIHLFSQQHRGRGNQLLTRLIKIIESLQID